MRLLIAIAALLVIAPAAQAECRRESAGPPVRLDRVVHYPRDSTRSRLIACDTRRGRAFLLAHGHLHTPFERRVHGSYVGGSTAIGRRVVWVDARGSRRRMVARIHLVRIDRRMKPIRTLVAGNFTSYDFAPPLDVLMTRRRELAWLMPGRGLSERVFLQRPKRPPRLLARGSFSEMALEDGRTLRLGGDEDEEIRYIDLHPQREPRCGGRSRFKTVFETDEVVITEADYGYPFVVFRACLRATGRDPAVISTAGGGEDEEMDVGGVDGPWVLFKDYCLRECRFALYTIKAGSGRRGHAYDTLYEPFPGLPLAINGDGVAAWVAIEDDTAWLLAANRRIDSGPPGSIANLELEGTHLTWTNGGVPKSAEIRPKTG